MRSIRNCSVAVVGGAGFLGSHLVNHLVEDRDCSVVVIDNLVAGRREFVHPCAAFEHFDITGSEDQLRGIFHQYRVQFVFNYAAYPYVPDSFSRPLLVFNVNAFGAMKVINAAQEAGAEAILQVSSAELYGEFGSAVQDGEGYVRRIREEDTVVPHSTYGAAKAAIDSLVQVRWREAKTPVIALRQFNCVGERETHPYIVPEIVSQLYRQDPYDRDIKSRNYGVASATVRLGNNSFRDFLYADDAVRMATELLEKGEFGEVYNLGSQEGIKIYDLAQLLSDIVGCGKVTIEEDPARKRPWEIWSLLSSNEKIYKVIESRPQLSLKEGLHKTVVWYESVGRKWPWEK